jgi:hypothetical protein
MTMAKTGSGGPFTLAGDIRSYKDRSIATLDP